jgi:hypothetical protein
LRGVLGSMDVRDVKVLPQRKRKGCQPSLEFDAATGSSPLPLHAALPPPPPAAAAAATDFDPLENDSAAVKGLSLDALGIYACDTKRRQFEFLDHTADIQIHSWGDSFAQVLLHFPLYATVTLHLTLCAFVTLHFPPCATRLPSKLWSACSITSRTQAQ